MIKKTIPILAFLLLLLPMASAITATGGTITNFTNATGTYIVHRFTTNSTFNVTSGSGNVMVLVVAGGGGGGYDRGSGGGAGGLIYNGSYAVNVLDSITVTVGAGGRHGQGGSLPPLNGGNSTFGTLQANGGGAGGSVNTTAQIPAKSGGSGGGGYGQIACTGGSATPAGQGNAGGNGNCAATFSGGGGGGAGGAGGAGGGSAGIGGVGLNYSINGSIFCYAGGGGSTLDGGAGGAAVCGGGAGSNTGVVGVAGTNGTGGGGGGGGNGQFGGLGGNGIVIVSYQLDSSAPVLTVSLTDTLTGVAISGWCLNATGSNTTQYKCNATGTTIGFNTTGIYNITAFNITAGNSSPQWFNVTSLNYNFSTGPVTLALNTFQAYLQVTPRQLYTNNSISQGNVTNYAYKNSTGPAAFMVIAKNGTNNIQVDVPGNYSVNVSCTAESLTSSSCTAAGIFDDMFKVNATDSATLAPVVNFTVMIINATLGGNFANRTTTNGSVFFPVLQGYDYTFVINSSAYSITNATRSANASTNTVSFVLRTANTFNFTFYNETTNAKILNQTIYLQILSADFAVNYTVLDGNLSVSLLTPGDYTITYWLNPDVPRNYYYTLTPQSFNTINLYVIDEEISNLYLPIVLNSNTVPVSNVTVQLLRDYIITGNTHAYSIVEMARTDTNGQAVLRVVPNIVFYKLIITDGTNTLSTAPTKFTGNTNTYTFNTEGNPTVSLVNYENIAKSIVFNNATLTYTYTWSDPSNIVSSGCLKVIKFKNGVQSTALANSCLAGSSGSIAHTINDTNSTSYIATGTLLTSTQYSTLLGGTLSVDFSSSYATFGLVGFIIAFIIFLTFVFVGGESGIAGAMVSGFVAILIAGAFGFIANSWTAVVIPAAIIVGIIIYRLRG